MTAPRVIDAATPGPPCCVCPKPECDTDESGDTCITASCGVCLHGCPAIDPHVCCLEQPDEPVAVLPEGEAGRTATPDHPDGGGR